MSYRALSKYVRVSPSKLRPVADLVRGLSVTRALALLKTYSSKRAVPLQKTIYSAYSNAGDRKQQKVSMDDFLVREIRVDKGPVFKYYKPGAMGRASIQRRRLSHVEVVVAEKVS